MIKPIKFSKKTVYDMEFTQFQTSKGVFRLSASHTDGTDEWREVGTANFYTWDRSKVYEWFVDGKIKPCNQL